MSPLKKLLFLALLPTLFLFSHGFSHNLHLQSTHIHGGGGENGVIMRRSLLKNFYSKRLNSTALVLAAERTRRKDPTSNFKYYTGGWNISNYHYYSSAAYTAAPLLIFAAIWFVGFGLALFILSICCCCRGKKSSSYSQTTYAISLALLSLFSITTIVGCIVLYTGQGKFFHTTTDTLDYVVYQANTTAQNLKGVSRSLEAAKGISFGQLSLPSNVKKSIDKVDSTITSASYILENDVYLNKNKIEAALHKVSIALIVVAAVMLLVAFLGFVFSILGVQSIVYILVMIGWILITVTFIASGLFLVLHNVAGDTCVAMEEWVRNPTAHTALDDILPCVDNATAREILSESKEVTYLLVGIVNEIIANVSNEGTINYNQSGPLVPLLCNPFNPDMSDRKCASNEVNFTNAKEVWEDYLCQVSGSKCTTIGRLTPGLYEQINNGMDVSFGIYHYGPFLISLLDCSFVRDTFAVIHRDDCPGLRQFSKWIYIGFLMASLAVMFSLVLWMLCSRERRRREYLKLTKSPSIKDSFVEKKVDP